MEKNGVSKRELTDCIMKGVAFPCNIGKRYYKIEDNKFKVHVKVRKDKITVFRLVKIRSFYSYSSSLGFFESVLNDFENNPYAEIELKLKKLKRWPFVVTSLIKTS